jgi:hypothetical protein
VKTIMIAASERHARLDERIAEILADDNRR